jgi:hypothetical protein
MSYELIRQIPRPTKRLPVIWQLPQAGARFSVLLAFFYLVEHRGLCMRTITAKPGIRVGRHGTVPPSQG